jgi:RsiW-degrading membrane proteinase PrsW (M82 family)
MIDRQVTQGCAALALVAAFGSLGIAFIFTDTISQQQVWALVSVGMFVLAATLMIAICASYLEEVGKMIAVGLAYLDELRRKP